MKIKDLKAVIQDILVEEGFMGSLLESTKDAVEGRAQIAFNNINRYKEQIKLLKQNIKDLEKSIKIEQDDINITKQITKNIIKLN